MNFPISYYAWHLFPTECDHIYTGINANEEFRHDQFVDEYPRQSVIEWWVNNWSLWEQSFLI